MKNLEWLAIAQRIQAIAQAGLYFTEGSYDRERYQELSDISVKILNQLTDEPIEKIEALFTSERDGYRTPKVDIRAVVFNEKREILLVCESADGKWSLPGGWADVGFTPKEVAVKETREESGIEVEPVRVLAIMDKKMHNHPPDPWYSYKIFILCKQIGGQALSKTTETTQVGFFARDSLPPLSLPRNLNSQVELMFDLSEKDTPAIYCD